MIQQKALTDKLQKVQETTDRLAQVALAAAEEGRAVDLVEEEIWKELLHLGNELLGCLFAQLGTGDVGPVIERENQKPLKRSKKSQKRRYRSVFGVFELERYTYAEQSKRQAERIPFDEQIALPSHDYSLLLEKWVGASACEDSFKQSVTFLEQMLNTRIPVDSAERICQRRGDRVEAFFEQLPTPEADEEGEILVESIDRKGVPLIRPHTEEPPVFSPSDEKGPKPDTKKMAVVGSVYSVDRHIRDADYILNALFRRRKTPEEEEASEKPPRPKHRRMRALLPVTEADTGHQITIDPAAAISGWISEEVQTRQGHVEEIALLCDGEDALWRNEADFRRRAIKVTEILDLMHAVSRIWTCGKHLHGDEPLESFVFPRLRRLLEGEASSVIRGFRRMATQRDLKGKARKAVDDACGYLERNLPRLRYDEYLSRGLPIATGMVEGACRYLVQDRMERTGMRWTIAGAQSILDLRSIKTSDLSDEYHTYYRSKQLSERYGESRTNYANQFQLAA